MVADCGGQLRVGGLGTPYALDYAAVMLVGQARGADVALLAELLPEIERAVLAAGADDDVPEAEEE